MKKIMRNLSLVFISVFLVVTLNINVKAAVNNDIQIKNVICDSNVDNKCDKVIKYGGNDSNVFIATTSNDNGFFKTEVQFDVILNSENAEIIEAGDSYGIREDYKDSYEGVENHNWSIEKNIEREENSYTIKSLKINTGKMGFSNVSYKDAYVCWFKVKENYSITTKYLVIDTNRKNSTTRISAESISLYNAENHLALYDNKGDAYSISTNSDNKSYIQTIDLKDSSINALAVKIEGNVKKEIGAQQSSDWLSSGENYVAINGSNPTRVDISNLKDGNYFSQDLPLKKGTNVIEVMCKSKPSVMAETEKRYNGKTYVTPFFVKEDVKEGITSLKNIKQAMGRSVNYYNYVFIVNWNGDERREEKSSDASLSVVEANEFVSKTNTEMGSYPVELKDGTVENPHRIALPTITEGESSKKILLGVTTGNPEAIWELEDKSLQRGDRVGKYIAIEVKDFKDGDLLKINVKAANGDIREHYFKIVRKSSSCNIKDLKIEGGTLKEEVSSNNSLYHTEVGNSQRVNLKVTPEDGASLTVNGKAISAEKGLDIEKEDFGKIVTIEVTAQDGVSKKNHYINFEIEGENQFLKVSKDTIKKTEELLSGWNNRLENEKKDMASEGYWGVFKSVATGIPLEDATVFDVEDASFTQATTYGAVILELVMLGENPYDFKGVNYVKGLLDCEKEGGGFGPYANNIWALMGLKAAGAEIPQYLIETVKGQAQAETFDLDMRGWAFAAAAPYMTEMEIIENLNDLKNNQLKSLNELKGDYCDEENMGLFLSNTMKSANTYTNGCVLSGIASNGVDPATFYEINYTNKDGKNIITNPLDAMKHLKSSDGKFYNSFDEVVRPGLVSNPGFTKDLIIGFGDVMNGSNVWERYTLNISKVNELLNKSIIQYNSMEEGTLKINLGKAIDLLKEALGTNNEKVSGLGDEYWNLHDAMADIDYSLVNKPKVRMCTIKDTQEVDKVISLIEKIDEESYESYKEILSAKEAYDSLGGSDSEKKLRLQGYVTNIEKLENAIEHFNLINKVVESINEIGEINFDNFTSKLEVTKKARELYDNLSIAQQKVVINYEKLQEAEKIIKDFNEIKTVIDEIHNLGEIKELSQETKVVDVRKKYNTLTEKQKSYVNNYEKLEEAEKKIEELRETQKLIEKVNNDIELLKKPLEETSKNEEPTWDIWSSWTKFVSDLRVTYEKIPEDRRDNVVALADLEKAEKYIDELQIKDVMKVISMLPKVEEISSTDESGNKVINITKEQIKQIAEAKSKYDNLTDKQKQSINENKDYLHLVNNLKEVDEIAKKYEEYIEAYLKSYIDEVVKLYVELEKEPVNNKNLEYAKVILEKYDVTFKDSKTYLYNLVLEGIENKPNLKFKEIIEEIRVQVKNTEMDLKNAKNIEDMISKLPNKITVSNMKDTEINIENIDKEYSKLSESAKTYVSNYKVLYDTRKLVSQFKEDLEEANKVNMIFEEAKLQAEKDLKSEKIISLIKDAEKSYESMTASAKELLDNSLVKNVLSLKEQIKKEINLENKNNPLVSILEELPWEVKIKVDIIENHSKEYGSLYDILKKEKDAELMNFISIKAYSVMKDGSTEDYTSANGFTIGFKLKNIEGNEFYIAQLMDNGEVEYKSFILDGNEITFKTNKLDSIALAKKEIKEIVTDKENSNTSKDNVENTNKDKNENPKTGDKLNVNMLILLSILSLVVILKYTKKRKVE